MACLGRWPLTTEGQVCSQNNPIFFEGKLVLGQVFLRVVVLSPVSIIPPTLHTRSFIYHRPSVILAFESALK
jgi:hypothetical protein